ncbi:hypothetical protein Cob_v009556 [Colletotrichum orbiculare MAFF 240422]|uniref:Uncharacterized protein n=1 Tax=Colletotrichum orbiculare (strain 104-T / ATCC 96160 / CBS 514.97 / LARS 414 / MAFF 240422) TaxID=1213857 RepID=A0A484FHX2_COLOR|nr:hypothetical protein Cob_v009556 [Colletotrichum orbiculare MAFF 240422]
MSVVEVIRVAGIVVRVGVFITAAGSDCFVVFAKEFVILTVSAGMGRKGRGRRLLAVASVGLVDIAKVIVNFSAASPNAAITILTTRLTIQEYDSRLNGGLLISDKPLLDLLRPFSETGVAASSGTYGVESSSCIPSLLASLALLQCRRWAYVP